MYYVYIVTNKHNSVLYIGITSNLEGRLFEHRERLIEGFTKTYQATSLFIMRISLILSVPLPEKSNSKAGAGKRKSR